MEDLALQTSPKINFFDYEIEEIEKVIGEMAGRKFHGQSFASYVYKHKVTHIENMMSLPLTTRQDLENKIDISPLPVKRKLVSKDGTIKFLFAVDTPKGTQEIETVYLPSDERVTLCVSSQVGCKMACKFCLTAQLGFMNHLRAGDIVRQIWTVENDPDCRPITNLVFMGMGEPFDNFEEVKKACRILTHHRGFDKSARKITVSTVGLVDKIDALQKEDPFNLAVSLNGTTDEIRSSIMPVNRRYPIEELMAACRRYAVRTNKKVTFEYILMAGLTDRDEDMKKLHHLMSTVSCKVNLIPYNESGLTEFKRPSDEQIQKFHKYLLDRDHAVFIRKNRGNDIYAACGMLKKLSPTI